MKPTRTARARGHPWAHSGGISWPVSCVCSPFLSDVPVSLSIRREDRVPSYMPHRIKYITFRKILSREREIGEIGRRLPRYARHQGDALKLWFRVHPTQDTDVQLINNIPRLTNELFSLHNHDITPYFMQNIILSI